MHNQGAVYPNVKCARFFYARYCICIRIASCITNLAHLAALHFDRIMHTNLASAASKLHTRDSPVDINKPTRKHDMRALHDVIKTFLDEDYHSGITHEAHLAKLHLYHSS